MMTDQETIAAIVTPPGKGGVGIVRVSGPAVVSIAKSLCIKDLQPRVAHFLPFINSLGNVLDQGLAIFFHGPNSYTGEDVLELQGHGGPVVLQQILQAVCEAGARLAKPGEFTERAFLNDKLDLAQAEAVADLIDASSEQAVRSAVQSLQGVFSQQVQELRKELIALQMLVEAAIDFPEEDIDFIQSYEVVERLGVIQQHLQDTFLAAEQGVIQRDGMTAVIAGRPNAGKSSLLNALSGRESAIVTEIAGTTRDTLREYIQIDGMPLHIVDTAGLRVSDDVIEQEGVRRAHAELSQADVVLLLVDVTTISDDEISTLRRETLCSLDPKIPVILLLNKIDLLASGEKKDIEGIYVSAKQGQGLDELRDRLKQLMGYHAGAGTFMARARHIEALKTSKQFIDQGLQQLNLHQASELLAEDLRLAQQALGKITGEFTNDDLLGEIFSSFCIGK